jgi:hypothetical protein
MSERDNIENVREKLLGAWLLVSWEEIAAGGETNYPLGKDAIGQISYSETGRVSAQLMRQHLPRFSNEDWQQATKDEKSDAWSAYFGYFGSYDIDLEKNAVTHHVEGSWFPNLIGTKQVRYFRFQGQQLILDADTEWGKVHIVWEKVR